MPMSDDVEKGIIVSAFGLAGTLIPVFMSWLRDRDTVSARARKIDEATKRVAFWEQWLRVSTALADQADASAVQKVKSELALLGEILASDSQTVHAELHREEVKSNAYIAKIHTIPFWRRWLLLYRPERSLAWFPRMLFFLGILTGIILILVRFNIVADPDTRLGFDVLFTMAIIWTAMFRFLSRWLEQPHASTFVPSPTPLPPPGTFKPAPPPPKP